MSATVHRAPLFLLKAFAFLVAGTSLHAQTDPPELSTWMRNTTGKVGYNNIAANVQQVRYSAGYVYVNSTGIPSYAVGPWPGNPNIPTNQNFVFKFTRTPAINSGTKTNTSLGVIGVWKDGVAIFNALDAFSYNNQNIWHRIAVLAEAPSFDGCLCHPAPGGVLHHHQNPRCLYTPDSTQHSPLLGYAFDGYPIYGPYGYADPNGSGGIARLTSSYALRALTQRHTLPDGTVLQVSQYGPDISQTYPLGLYAEDYEYLSGSGLLDKYNGRICITPEYPGGTYAYFVTINADGSSAYPYYIGPQYYGTVVTEDVSSGGHAVVSEPVSVYSPSTAVSRPPGILHSFVLDQNYPNPFNPTTVIRYSLTQALHVTLRIFDIRGNEVRTLVDGRNAAGDHQVVLDASGLSSGIYFYSLTAGEFGATRKLLLLK